MKEGWEAVIGMEIHAQLATDTKIFCGCAVETGGEPNSQYLSGMFGIAGRVAGFEFESDRIGRKCGAFAWA